MPTDDDLISNPWHVQLDIPAWPEAAPPRISELRPMIVVSYQQDGHFYGVAQLSITLDKIASNDRWIIQRFNKVKNSVICIQTKELDTPKFNKPQRWEGSPTSYVSNENLFPRPTLNSAWDKLSEIISERAKPKDLSSLKQVLTILRDPFERASKSYATNFKPK